MSWRTILNCFMAAEVKKKKKLQQGRRLLRQKTKKNSHGLHLYHRAASHRADDIMMCLQWEL